MAAFVRNNCTCRINARKKKMIVPYQGLKHGGLAIKY